MTESKDLQEFISKYLERGFGSMNKNDFEVWIFHYLMNHQLQGKTNYEVSLFLKIPETKVKRLRYEAELKYNDGDSLVNYHKVCALLKAVHFKKGGQCIQFSIEDLYLRKYLDSTLKSGGRFSDSSFKITSCNFFNCSILRYSAIVLIILTIFSSMMVLPFVPTSYTIALLIVIQNILASGCQIDTVLHQVMFV